MGCWLDLTGRLYLMLVGYKFGVGQTQRAVCGLIVGYNR